MPEIRGASKWMSGKQPAPAASSDAPASKVTNSNLAAAAPAPEEIEVDPFSDSDDEESSPEQSSPVAPGAGFRFVRSYRMDFSSRQMLPDSPPINSGRVSSEGGSSCPASPVLGHASDSENVYK